MKRGTSRVLVIVMGVIVVYAVVYGIRYAMTGSTTTSSMPSSYTKEQYLQKLRDKGADDASICAYNQYIDAHGVEATFQADMEATADPNSATSMQATQELANDYIQCQN